MYIHIYMHVPAGVPVFKIMAKLCMDKLTLRRCLHIIRIKRENNTIHIFLTENSTVE